MKKFCERRQSFSRERKSFAENAKNLNNIISSHPKIFHSHHGLFRDSIQMYIFVLIIHLKKKLHWQTITMLVIEYDYRQSALTFSLLLTLSAAGILFQHVPASGEEVCELIQRASGRP